MIPDYDKIVAYTALHYGSDYLGYAIRSIINDVSEYVVLYSPVGSHGHQTDMPCPDTRETLYDIAQEAAGDKLRWFDGQWPHEGAQRDNIFEIAGDAHAIVVLDADEIWPSGLLLDAVGVTSTWAHRNIRIPMWHYWRSFKQGFMHDPAYPVRVIHPHWNNNNGDATFTRRGSDTPMSSRVIHHLGYAQRSEIVKYKLLTHGHRNEIRRDCDWFTDIFMNPARKTDLHLVGSDQWNVEPIETPDFMMDHPYAQLEIIE